MFTLLTSPLPLGYDISMAASQGMFYERLGARIRKARRAANVTQAELAASIGISRTSLTNIEGGRQPVYVHTLARLGEVLGIGIVAFFDTMTSEMPKSSLSARKLRGLTDETRSWVERVISSDSKASDGDPK